MSLLLHHPEIPSCEDCQTWLYRANWERDTRGGEPVRRDPGTPLPCRRCPKGKPDGRPHPEKELSPRNLVAYFHYLECRATGQFPDDPIVRHNAALIRAAEDSAARSIDTGMMGLLSLMAQQK